MEGLNIGTRVRRRMWRKVDSRRISSDVYYEVEPELCQPLVPVDVIEEDVNAAVFAYLYPHITLGGR